MNYFIKLDSVSTTSEFLKNTIPLLDFAPTYGDIILSILDPLIFKDDPIYPLINKFGIGEAKKVSIFKFMPNTSYAWHTDGIRSAAINMLISGFDSLTLFGNKSGKYFTDVKNVDYEPNRYFLLNTRASHTIINFTETRYLLSLGIPEKYSFY